MSDGPARKGSGQWLVVKTPAPEGAGGATLPAPAPSPIATPAAPRPDDRTPWDAARLPVLEHDQRYQLLAEIARGGIGRVLRAYDRRLGRTIVLKELLGAAPDAIDRFLREAHVTARLQHPAIVPVHDAGRWPNGIPFYAMKEVSGPSLDEVIARTSGRSERIALLPIVLTVADAMAYAHSQRIIHRDLKPANVVVGPFGETVVIDWGLAKDISQGDSGGMDDAVTLTPEEATDPPAIGQTLAGAVMGTPAYMPPEQARGERVDERADVYALGAMLYHLLAGAPPYTGATSREIVERVLAAAPPPLARRVPHLPHDLTSIVEKAMARERSERYPSAREFAEDLKRHQTGQLVASHRYSRVELVTRWMARHRAPVAVSVAFLLVLGVLAALGVRKISRGRQEAEARKNELVLLQARSAVDRDPTAAVAWLKEYPAGGPDWETARAVAIDAVNRGVATEVLSGHTGMVWRLAFSPDGTQFASASSDGTVRLWDLASGRATRVLTGHGSEVDCVRFSPDGTLLASGSDDKTVRLWDVATGASRVLTGHNGAVIEAVFFAHGTRLATASYDRTIRVWDVASGTGRVLATLEDAGDLNQLAVAPDERHLAAVGKDRNIYVLDVDLGAQSGGAQVTRTRVLHGHDGIVRGVAWSPDGRWLASASYDKTVRLWDMAAGAASLDAPTPSQVLSGHEGRVYYVAFSPDGTALASASEDETVRVWDLAHGAESRVLRGHQGIVSTVTFSPDGRRLASAGFDKRIRLWDVPPFESRAYTGFGTPRTRAATFAPDGRTLAFSAADGTIALVDVATGALRPLAIDATEWLVFSPDSRQLGAVGADGIPRVWDVTTGASAAYTDGCDRPLDLAFSPDGRRAVLNCGGLSLRVWPLTAADAAAARTFGGYTDSIQSMRWSPDGTRIASTCGTEVWLWDVASGGRTVLHGHEGWVAPGFRFSDDGARLATASNDQTARVWDVAGGGVGTAVQVLAGHESGVRDATFSPDGKLLATAGYDKTVRLWDLATGGSRVLRGHRATIHHLAFAPDSKTLASSSSADLTIRLWDVATGASRGLYGHTDAINAIAFTPDGSHLLSTSDDHTVRLWTAVVGTALPDDAPALRRWLEHATTAVLDADHLPTSP